MADAVTEDRPWTLENVRDLHELAAAKAPASLIALRMRRSQTEVREKASELGLLLSPE